MIMLEDTNCGAIVYDKLNFFFRTRKTSSLRKRNQVDICKVIFQLFVSQEFGFEIK